MSKERINNVTAEERINTIAAHWKGIMETLGLNMSDSSLKDTPNRVAKMLVNELCSGLFAEPPKATMFSSSSKDMVVVKEISFNSMCEHHFLPFIGKCHVGYIPNGKEIIGLSKISRIVKYFAAKPQVQENLLHEIGTHLQKVLKTQDVAVIIDAVHLCAKIRGVEDPECSTVTAFMGGHFTDNEVKSEFLKYTGL